MSRGELVSENRREELVCLKCSEGLVTVMAGARQGEQLGSWRCGRVATWPELV